MPRDSDNSPVNRRRGRLPFLMSSPSSSSEEESWAHSFKRKSRHRLSSSSSDSGESIIFIGTSNKKLRILSDNESESDSEFEGVLRQWTHPRPPRNTHTILIDSDSSDEPEGNDDTNKSETTPAVVVKSEVSDGGSDSDDGEKCIICFKAFRGVVARPSGCRHTFHSECLLTWSKTSNTCPIDRVKYTQVVVQGPEGNIVSRHGVTTPPPQAHDDIEPDDPTFCEVCHQHDREHEMLLCDRCEDGYHLNCLTPPLREVPVGDWYCPGCTRNDDDMIDDEEINDLLSDGGGILESRMRHRTPATPRRIGPRTRAAQRVIAAIRRMADETERFQPSSSTSRSNTRRTQRRKKSNRRRNTHYKVELITVEDGSTIEVKVAVNTKVRRKKKRKSNNTCGRGRKSAAKRHSASGSGIDSRNHRGTDNSIIQPLDIMGSRPQLDYFSGCEAEDELDEDGGLSMLRARSSVANARTIANRKQIAAQVMRSTPRRPLPRIAVSSAPPDLLSSILDEQTKWHSPNTIIQSNSNGEVKVILPDKSSSLPTKKAAGNGEATGSSNSVRSSSAQQKEGGSGQSNGNGASTSSVPPLQPPPQPNFSRVYEDEDFDLYADIEPPRLAPPPEPPALLLALEGDEAVSSPEDTMLVIDDRQTYDPDVPTSPPPSPGENPDKKMDEKEEAVKPPATLSEERAIDLSSIRLPSPDPDIDDCPNRVIYSEASINIAKEKEDSDGEIDLTNPPPMLVNKVCIDSNSDITRKCNTDNVDIKDSVEPSFDNKVDPEIEDAIKSEDDIHSIKNDTNLNSDDKNDPEITMKQNEMNSKSEDIKPIIEDEILENVKDIKENDEETKLKEVPEEEKTNDFKDENNVKKDFNSTEEVKVDVSENQIKEDDEANIEEGELKDDDEKEEIEDEFQELRIVTSEPERDVAKNERHSDDDDDTDDDDDENCSDKRSPSLEEKTISFNEKDNDISPDVTPQRKLNSEKETDQEGEDVLELGCGEDERDGLVDITDEEISTYEKSWELEDNRGLNKKTAGLEGLETEAISEGEDNMAEEGHTKVTAENGPKEEGEIISDEKRVPVAWKKATKAKERSYRDKDSLKEKSKKKEKKPKEKRKELERYDVRKIISDKPKKRKVDEFGRDISSRSQSLSDSRSKSRSLSVKSRRSRSRSRSRSKKRRSRERRSRNRSRGRSRGRSRLRSKSRDRRRVRSKSRSRSGSRRRKSRSPRKKERQSRAKSREKKRRKRDSSISCSSCSCSSCERERRKSKKLTVIVPNAPARKDKKKNKYKERGENKRRRVDSPVPSKEVFTSGDNILVSVNFKSSKSGELSRKEVSRKKREDETRKKKDKGSKENQPLRSIVSKSGSNQLSQRRRLNARNLKPVAIIDLAQSPFREQTLSPKEIIILTDSDSDDKRKPDENNLASCQITGPKTPPEPHIKFNIVSSKPQILRSLANPLLDSVDQLEVEGEEEDERVDMPHKGPNTPPEPPVPYDPFEPTKSRSPTPLQELVEIRNPTPPGDKILLPEPTQRPVSPPKTITEPPKTPSPLHSPPPKPTEDVPIEKAHISPPNNCNDDSMDMGGGDSPYSPGSSDGDDIFEPSLPPITTSLPLPKTKSRPGPKILAKLTPSPLKRKPGANKTSTPLKNNKGGKKESMKLDEDQLKILDDLPNSAVEMQVKDKFLKKLNRQERVVEEVKLVLKPHYAKKHVNKEEYKEILRKAVPKICHSRSGEINPMKIQRLIEAYVKKYRHLRKKRKMAPTFGGPDSIPLLKPKPKTTMWC